MFCPTCSKQSLAKIILDEGLSVRRCTHCSGIWVDLDTYRVWRRNANAPSGTTPAPQQVAIVDEDKHMARTCPRTQRLMTRIKVSNDAPFRLDYSPAAQGVWLDRGEWEALMTLGLERQLDAIVSERWQRGLQSAASQARIEQVRRTRFGDAAYDELTRINAWLKTQPERAEMLAYLNAKAD